MSSATLTLGTRIAAFGFSLATNVILARTLGPEGRGIYAVAVLVPALISLFLQLGLQQANVYHFSKGLIEADELLGHATALALLLGAVGFAGVCVYVVATGSGRFAGIDAGYVLLSSTSLPFLLVTVFLQGILNGAERFRQYNLVLLTQYAAPTPALAVAMIAFRGSALAAVAAWTVAAVVTALVAMHGAAALGRMWPRLSVGSLRKLLRFGLIGYMTSLTSFVNYRFDVLIVNLFAGAREVGLYAVGTGLAEAVWYVANAAGIVLAPKVAASEQTEGDRMTEGVCRVVTGLALAAAVVLAIAAPFAVVLFFGQAFAESAWAVWLLLPGIVTFSVARVISMYLLGRNQLKVDLVASTIGLIVTLALDFALIPRFGFRGAAVASSIAYTCAMLVDLLWVTRSSSMRLSRMLVPRPDDARVLAARLREATSAVSGRRRTVSGA